MKASSLLRALAVLLLVPCIGTVAYGAMRMTAGDMPGKLLSIAMVVALLVGAGLAYSLVSSRGRRWVDTNQRKILALGVASLFALIMLDVMLTVTGIVPTMAAMRAAGVEYRARVYARHQPVPQRKQVMGGEILINSKGTYGPEFETKKADGVTRVLFLGGSHVFAPFPAMMGEMLRECGRKIEVINGSAAGHMSMDSVGKLATDYWRHRPDYVVAIHAWNDIKYFSSVSESRPLIDVVEPYRGEFLLDPIWIDDMLCVSAFWRSARVSLLPRLAGLRPLLEGGAADRATTPGVVHELALEQYRLNLQMLCDICKNIGAQPVLCIQARLPTSDVAARAKQSERIVYEYVGLDHEAMVAAFARCDEIIRSVAREKGAHLIEATSKLTGSLDYFGDHIHVNEEGSKAMAAVLAEAMESLLPGGR